MDTVYQLPKSLKYICIGFQGLAVLVAVFSVWAFFQYGIIDQSLDAYWDRLSDDSKSVVTYSALKKTLLTTLATIGYFAPVLILFGAFRSLQAFRKGDPFRRETSKSVRFLGVTIVAYAVSKIFIYSLVVYILTYDNPGGQKEFSVAVDNQTLMALLIGAIIMIIGHILTQATELADENRQFV